MMRAMKIATITLVLLVLGCSKKESADQGKGSAAPTGISCADAIGKAVTAMPQAPGGEQVIAKLSSLMTARCEADKWSVAARECYATQVKDMAGMKKCRETTLTPEQNTAVMTEIRAAMMAASAGGAGPMHASPSGSGSAGPGSAGSGSAK
jgi:hypothetical protein